MKPDEIVLAEALANVLDGPEEHTLGPTDARLVVRALRIAAAVGWAVKTGPKSALKSARHSIEK